MNTNFQMLRELIQKKKFSPENHGYLTGEEVQLIETVLCLDEMDILQLRNLRDMTVMWLCNLDSGKEKNDTRDFRDIMSGITAVIDTKIFGLGGEV